MNKEKNVNDILEVLLNSSNGAWRDDAAEELASHSDASRAEEALLIAIESDKLDDSLRRTCAESLAEIWISSGIVYKYKIDKLTGISKVVVEAFIEMAESAGKIKIY